MSSTPTSPADAPPHRYTPALAAQIEEAWQARWTRERTFEAPNPAGPLAGDDGGVVAAQPKLYVLDMFPYPTGAGLHVGHPLGYIGTDVFARYHRMLGRNVLHAMGYDAFGLPAEQYAVQTGQHPRVTTEANIATMRRQLGRLGLGHDPRRSVATTDPEYYRWTQWIFLQVFGSWYDHDAQRARPISELEAAFAGGERPTPDGRPWAELDPLERRQVIDGHRLVYLVEAPVNWCPGLGTVLANEEVTADGRSERGNFPVFKRPLKQWVMRITAYADRLIADLDDLDWSEAIKLMQRNWIGRSEGARVDFGVRTPAGPEVLTVFTTRPDTLFGATFMVLAPEHPLVGALTAERWPDGTAPAWTGGAAAPADALAAYRFEAGRKSEVERQVDSREKTGVFTGSFATNPVNGAPVPVFVADYVLMGYGTGAIMAVPAEDERDWAFAEAFGLPIVRTVQPPDGFAGSAFTGDGTTINSGFLDGLGMAEAKATITAWLEAEGTGERTTTYKLRDWLFSRQRYWGEPFPIVYDETGLPIALPESMLPVMLPDVDDYSPRTFAEDDVTSEPESPLSRATSWVEVELDLGDGPRTYHREVNTMPQWAGSCWYELRYLDPTNSERFVDADVERYWMGPRTPTDPGGVDLYVGGVEHAVLHLLYARFWHKVLYDLGLLEAHNEPFRRLYNQGYILAAAFTDERGMYVPAAEVAEHADGGATRYSWEGQAVTREYGKMGKSLKNAVTPDDMYAEYGADTLRLYEMSMGPLDASRPWETRQVAGVFRFLQRLWRNTIDEETGELRVSDAPAEPATRTLLHRTIDGVGGDMAGLRFNTAIAKLIEANNHLTSVVAAQGAAPREVVESMVLLLAPLAPHVAEELWQRLGHGASLAHAAWPVADPALLVEAEVEVPVQVNGKVRARVKVASGADDAAHEAAARSDGKVAAALAATTVRKVIVVPGRLVNFVVG